jgi:hypothetical protein
VRWVYDIKPEAVTAGRISCLPNPLFPSLPLHRMRWRSRARSNRRTLGALAHLSRLTNSTEKTPYEVAPTAPPRNVLPRGGSPTTIRRTRKLLSTYLTSREGPVWDRRWSQDTCAPPRSLWLSGGSLHCQQSFVLCLPRLSWLNTRGQAGTVSRTQLPPETTASAANSETPLRTVTLAVFLGVEQTQNVHDISGRQSYA